MPKDIITKFECNNKPLSYITNLILAVGKFHIHQARFSKSFSNFNTFLVEFNLYIDTLTLTTNKKVNKLCYIIKNCLL